MEKNKTAVQHLMKRYHSQGFVTAHDVLTSMKMENEQLAEAWNDGNMLGRNAWVQEEYSDGPGYVEHIYGTVLTNWESMGY